MDDTGPRHHLHGEVGIADAGAMGAMAEILTLARHGVSGFFEWWLAELAGLMPRLGTGGRRRERSRLVLTLDDQVTVLGRGERALGRAEANDPGDLERLVEVVRRQRGRQRSLVVRLGPTRGLVRELDLPLAARDDLAQLLRFEMDRLTPFAANQVYGAHRIVAEDPQSRRMKVALHVAPKAVVDEALAICERLGMSAVRVELSGDGPSPNLLPEPEAAPRGGSWLTRGLAVLAVILAIAAVAMPLRQQRSTAADLARRVATAKAEAEESLALREQLDALSTAADFLAAAKTREPMVTEVLAELTRIVPDHAYVAQLQLRDGTLQLYGFAETASDLIGLLAQSELFRAPQFRSPVTQDPRGGLERFHVAVDLAGKGE